ncbi:MAG: TetR/AcrR family transcriptional regulator [Myxococcales bacterium]|jgi:AcrR family transcriptional regulator
MPIVRKAYHHGELRESLLELAEQQLEKDGPAGLSLRKLGRKLGVSPGAPYRHFEDKDGLLAALATLGFKRLRQMMLDAQEGSIDGEERLRRAGIGYVGFASRHPELFRLMFGWMPSRDVPELQQSGDAAFAVLVDTLTACEQEGLLTQSPLEAGLLAWSAVHGASFLLIDDGLQVCDVKPNAEEVANRLHASMWSGIGRSKVSVDHDS